MPGTKSLLKVVILGNGGVGKSSLMNRFVNNEFDAQSFHTIGVEFLNKDLQIDGDTYTMQIWDTAGQERFKSLRTPFYRGADCCMLCYDVTDQPSFKNLGMWKKEFTHYADVRDASKFPFVLLGNKVDCSPSERAVPHDAAEAWCAENGNVPYFETSAKDNINVEMAFVAAAQQVKKCTPVLTTSYADTVDLSAQKTKCCV
mmetsp:Transcript_19608/g.50992  ORF Transcript_19608/g.50992 Transcript_19608/m.50992 type:complete len:201 (+) Transcript_19608:83-685(+)